MTNDRLFGLANALPLVGWFALMLAPLARSRLVAAARVVAVVLAVGYVIGIAAAVAAGGGPMPDMTTLSGLAHAFSTPRVMLVGWVHCLAFDLWVGTWEIEEAGCRGMRHAALVPCAFGAPLRGCGARPRRSPTAPRSRSIKDPRWPSQARAVPSRSGSGAFLVRQGSRRSGASLSEAIRAVILIAALHIGLSGMGRGARAATKQL